jgi:CTP:molybdopterin cytidylyltransferase MocA
MNRPRRRVDAIVLSAGSSTRLGRPKALLPLEGTTLLARVLATLREAGLAQGVVVLGEHAEEILAAVEVAPFVARRNPHPEAGRMGSVHVGLDVVASGADVLLWPIDRPFASAATVRALVDAAEGAGAGNAAPGAESADRADDQDSAARVGWIVPAFGRGRGHPALLRAPVLAAVRAAPADASLREVLAASGTTRLEVPVEDAGIHPNLDTDADWERALAWWSHRTQRP